MIAFLSEKVFGDRGWERAFYKRPLRRGDLMRKEANAQ